MNLSPALQPQIELAMTSPATLLHRPKRAQASLEVECRRLPPFDARELAAIQNGFQKTEPIPFRQAWLATEQKEFAPGAVRLGWNDDALLIFAELDDRDILTRASGPNQRLWELGDVFEIFLKAAGHPSYVELQVSPNNCRLQLRFPNAVAVKAAREADDFNPYLLWTEDFYSATWVKPAEAKWFVFVKAPQHLVCPAPAPLPGQRWRFSFSRFDYTQGAAKPVASSTSLHKGTEFHCQEEWGTMEFK